MYMIVSAMPEEMAPFREKLMSNSFRESEIFVGLNGYEHQDGRRILTLVTGVGKSNAASGLALALYPLKEVTHVINIGACCGISEYNNLQLVQGEVIFDKDNRLKEPIKIGEFLFGDIDLAKMGTGDSILEDEERAESYKGIIDTYDMETYVYAEVSRRFKTQFSVIRFISDTGDADWEEVFESNLQAGSEVIAERLFNKLLGGM